MEKFIIFHNPRWGKSRKSVKILEDNNINFDKIEYLKNAPTINQLKIIIKKLNLKPKELLRKGEKIYKNLNIQSFLDNDEKILIYRMYMDEEVNLPLSFIQKLRVNYALNIFNDVINWSKGDKWNIYYLY